MGCTFGYYINVYDYPKDVFIIVNEANDNPTIEQNDEAVEYTKEYLLGNWTIEKLEENLEENLFPFGVQIVERRM